MPRPHEAPDPTPDASNQEVSGASTPIREAATDLPTFIGYTARATGDEDFDLVLKPVLLGSIAEYDELFHSEEIAHPISVTLAIGADGEYSVSAIAAEGSPGDQTPPAYLMRHSLEMFFSNGGRRCFVLSVGGYRDPPVHALRGDGGTAPISIRYGLLDGLEAAATEIGPSLLVVPEAIHLPDQQYAVLVQAMLAQCDALRDRFAIFDLFDGGRSIDIGPAGAPPQPLTDHRALFGARNLMFGACYYPFLRSTLTPAIAPDESNVTVSIPGANGPLGSFRDSHPAVYARVRAALDQTYLTLPPSAAIAGLYASTDRERGVWKAPANVGLTRVVEPTVPISSSLQEVLNVDATTGKSINAIREFPGRGTLVWGARTLAGNDPEWRHLSVRRFMTAVEVSIRESTRWAVLEPNERSTWNGLRVSIEKYLTGLWRSGGLAGTSPQEAFFVRCGAGSTMSTQDILEGRITIEMGLAVVRPAEFYPLRIGIQVEEGRVSPSPDGSSVPGLPALPFALVWEHEQVGFAETSGLQAVDAVDYRSASVLNPPRTRLPARVKSGNVTLKRGITTADSSFLRWLRTAGDRGETRDLTITRFDAERRVVGTWRIRNARPNRFVGPGTTGADDEDDTTAVEIELVEIAHDGLERETY